ncbi:MAG: tRNA uridine-5-carboxymethylaminomethyl(34) synthesis enzyme MnmG, partial [Culicoidibacterales bacterium]
MKKYDVIVIGGGHAGCEAALAPARMGLETLMITGSIEMIAHMPCNPSIGGPAKGIVVREIDALGGEMGRNTDKTNIQMKMLNLSKGPAVWSLRAQADKIEYPQAMQETILQQQNLAVLEAMVEEILVENDTVIGVKLETGDRIEAKTVILTTGTYLKSQILVGHTATDGGPSGQRSSIGLSTNLRELGLELFRLKTGTPARVAAKSINYDKTTIQPGDDVIRTFSFDTPLSEAKDPAEQLPCYLTYTAPETHVIINENLGESAMYSGMVEGTGPRYCPSIEDKLVRFADKERHQIFLEPESKHSPEIYVQGFSTSMPHDVQEKMLRSLPGLEDCEIIRYAYAIEYDAIVPTQLWTTLETKKISGLFSAGQMNGTSGYEEAAGQGLIAGINAALKVRGEEQLVLRRDEAYIGVLIDDLVTKGTDEPYRLLTSRAEYRLLLRHDNADLRLRPHGNRIGLIDQARQEKFAMKVAMIEMELARLQTLRITPKAAINEYLASIPTTPIRDGISLAELMKRPEVEYRHLAPLVPIPAHLTPEVIEQVEIQIKYEGYITKAMRQAERVKDLESKRIPATLDYAAVPNLANEARQKLAEIRPLTIGQASRISGVNPAD